MTVTLALPLAQSGRFFFDAYGNYSHQIPLTPGLPQQFYRLQLP